jgi:hypothetical protein
MLRLFKILYKFVIILKDEDLWLVLFEERVDPFNVVFISDKMDLPINDSGEVINFFRADSKLIGKMLTELM